MVGGERNVGVERLGLGFSVLIGLALAIGILVYSMGKSGKDLSLHGLDGGGVGEVAARVTGFVHSIDAAGRSLTVRESPVGGPRYRTVLLTPGTEFLAVSRARGLDALDHPNGERRIRPDEVTPGDYVVVSVTAVPEGLRAATVTIVHSARG